MRAARDLPLPLIGRGSGGGSVIALLLFMATPAQAQRECTDVGHPGDPHITRSICRIAEPTSFECSPVFDLAGGPDATSVAERVGEIIDLIEIGTCASVASAAERVADAGAFSSFAEVQGAFTRRYARLATQLASASAACASRDPGLPDEGLSAGMMRACLAAARQWADSIPPELGSRHCHAFYERVSGVPDDQIVAIDVEENVAVDSAYYRRGMQYIVVSNIDPNAVVDVIDGGREGMAVGEVALRVVSVAMGSGLDTEDRAAEDIPSRGRSGFATRVFAITMRAGEALLVRVRRPGESAITEVQSGTSVSFVLGAAFAPLDVLVQVEGAEPFGQLSSDGTNLVWLSQPALFALTVHAFAGLRIEDELVGVGIVVVSTTGDPLRGVSLHYGHRFRSLSQAMYIGLFAGMRWSSRPDLSEDVPATTDVALLRRNDYYAVSFGLEILFDLAAALSNPQGILGALF